MIVFDIETAALDDEQLLPLFSFSEPPCPGEFDPTCVKLGNLKDEAKIKQKIDEARAAHAAAVANHTATVDAARDAAWTEFVGRAALSPLTGRVLCIGYHSTDKGVTVLDAGEKDGGGESELLGNFWRRYEACRREKRFLVGHNIAGFDVPFLVRRSWLLEVPVPATVFDRGKWLDSLVFVDTMQLWQCGTRDQWVKLDVLSKAFGGNGKPVREDGEQVTGGQFAALWRTDRAKAEAYLINDLQMTVAVAAKMGLL